MSPDSPSPTLWQERAIFVSSTFRDMHSERDCLRDHVFCPAFVERLRDRRCHLVPIDLRWGVDTVGLEAKEATVLQVCFDEVCRAKPLMLVILGDRYGWVPPHLQTAAVFQANGLPIHDFSGKSVTALEIEYGALTDDGDARVLFLFRDLDTDNGYRLMQDSERKVFDDRASGYTENWSRLKQLKAAIRERYPNQCHDYTPRWDPVAQRLVLPDEWPGLVQDELWKLIDAETHDRVRSKPTRWEELARRDLLDEVEVRLHGIEKQAQQTGMAHGTNVHRSTHENLLAFARGQADPDQRALCLMGDSGSGKSVLFARLARELGAYSEMPNPAGMSSTAPVVLAHMVGAGLNSTDPLHLLKRWCRELSELLGPPVSDYEGVFALRAMRDEFQYLLAETSSNRDVILLLDGLDQMDPSPDAKNLSWLPHRLPMRTQLVVTTTRCDAATVLIERPGARQLPLPALNEDDAKNIVQAHCGRYHKSPNESLGSAVARRALQGLKADSERALWVSIVVERLLLLDAEDFAKIEPGDPGSADARILSHQLDLVKELPLDIGPLHEKIFERAQSSERSWVPDCLALISVSRQGLRERELRNLLGIAAPEHDLAVAATRRILRGHVRVRKGLETWDFLHASPRLHLLKVIDAGKYCNLNARIAQQLCTLPPDDVLRGEIMHHLIEAGKAAEAAEYFGGSLEGFERSAAVRALVDHVVAAEIGTHHFDFIYELVASAQPSDRRARIARRLIFDVTDKLAAVTRIDTREQLIERCIVALDDVIENPTQGVNRVEAQHDLLEAWRKRRSLRIAKNDPRGAMLAARRVIDLAEALREAEPTNSEWVHDSMIAHADWGDTLDKLGDLSEARAAYEAALDCSDQLVNSYRETDPHKFARAAVASRAGAYLMKSGDLVAARCALEEALEALESLFDPGRTRPEVERSLAAVHRMFGELTRAEDASQWETSLEHFRTAIEFLSDLRTDDPRNRAILHDVARIHGVTGDILRAQARSNDALSAYCEALNLLRVLASLDPDNSECQHDMDLCKLWIRDLDPDLDPDSSA